MFDIKRALSSALQTHPDDELSIMYTTWGESIDPGNVLSEYPRPQMRRESYANLNGWWECTITNSEDQEGDPIYSGRILVPFSPESPLSGVNHQLQPHETIWYRRSVSLFKRPGKRYLLHFGAVDCECECIVNGYLVGTHQGGYTPFTFDITDALLALGSEESVATIDVAVKDPSEHGLQPRGKQRLDRGSIWYTAQSGIWQTVWMEEVPETYIESLAVRADTQNIALVINVKGPVPEEGMKLTVDLFDEGEIVTSKDAMLEDNGIHEMTITNANAHLWTPDDPHLYDIGISLGHDAVGSYCAFRSFGIETLDGAQGSLRRFCCNGKPLFLKGVLDQGYWPDGLLTAPSDEALLFDIELAHDLGFNMMRKHLKVEPARWYYHCDRLGMIVWQDMVNGGAETYPAFYTSQLPTVSPHKAKRVDDTKKLERFGSEDPTARELWMQTAIETIEALRFFPCIASWTIFNEGWGQFNANDVCARLREIDDSRPFDQASGWFDQGGGDYVSEHNYFRDIRLPKGLTRHDARARVISEFGGCAMRIDGHSSIDRSYGYAQCETIEEFIAQVKSTLKQADDLEDAGLSGYVYTQLTDVEEEVNGLVSYDRRVNKMAEVSQVTPQEPSGQTREVE